ncbi:MAG: DNA-binding protein Fis [Edaphobacter sp.]|nr:DNA-binding protein Fis [Edaphobacter sp.]
MNAGRPGIVTDYSLRESEPCVNVESTMDDGREKSMSAQTIWASEAPTVSHPASFEIEEAVSARVAFDSSQHRGSGLPRMISNSFGQVIGKSPALKAVLEQVELVAPTDSTVLIQGETGTGKELIAQAIHNTGLRRGRPFVKLNCAAIPLDLLESELFGHERGAFTGAIAQKIGRFELADKGTLFLDEVGDIPLALQPKLLRVLQEQEFERLGSNRTHQVDVRLVAATNRDLMEMVNRGQFRSDLYYRLNVFPVLLPPLRERREDIPALVAHFVEYFGRRMGRQIERIPPETMSAFSSYQWPGNIRELQNLIQRAVILSNDGVLPDPLPAKEAERVFSPPTTLMDSERALILQTLQAVGWVIGGEKGAAARLGLKRTTLMSRMSKMGISRPPFQSRHDVMGPAAWKLGSAPQA